MDLFLVSQIVIFNMNTPIVFTSFFFFPFSMVDSKLMEQLISRLFVFSPKVFMLFLDIFFHLLCV